MRVRLLLAKSYRSCAHCGGMDGRMYDARLRLRRVPPRTSDNPTVPKLRRYVDGSCSSREREVSH